MAAAEFSSLQVLGALALAGMLGMAGQGVRAVGGLKKMNDEAQKNSLRAFDLFSPSRFVVSLIIGFIAGMLAALGLGLEKFIKISADNMQLLLGIAAAGYGGTDFIEAFARNLSKSAPPAEGAQPQAAGAGMVYSTPMAMPAAAPIAAPPAIVTAGMHNPKWNVTFESLVPGGFYSADPDDMSVRRSIRTNNPGALNISKWQKDRPGFVGETPPDNSPNKNKTTIYRTPEHGVAAWYVRVSRVKDNKEQFTIAKLAESYAGSADSPLVAQYKNGWRKWSQRFSATPLEPTAVIRADNLDQMLLLAKCMFAHEASVQSPLRDEQILFAMQSERDVTLPA